MLPDKLAIDVVSADRISPYSLVRRLRKGGLIVSIPDHLQWLNQTLPAWPDEVCGVVSTAPCLARVDSFPGHKGLTDMTEIYGSSRISGIGVRVWPDNAYRLMPHWRHGDSSDLEEIDLVHSSEIRAHLPDRLQVFEDGTFLLDGRKDGGVKVGGMNVYPARVAALLLARPGVANVIVRLCDLKRARVCKPLSSQLKEPVLKT